MFVWSSPTLCFVKTTGLGQDLSLYVLHAEEVQASTARDGILQLLSEFVYRRMVYCIAVSCVVHVLASAALRTHRTQSIQQE